MGEGEKVVHVKEAEFDDTVVNADTPVLVDFWAPWCGPCHMIAPVVEELATEYDGRVKVTKVNVDENPNIAAKYGIRSIPTILLFKGGQVQDQVIGAVGKDELSKKLESVLK
jgi:thioredoxin 1